MSDYTRFYFRLANDPNNDKALWTGAVSVEGKATKAEGRRAVRERLRVKQLPANTLVLSARELERGQWDDASIREATASLPASEPRKPRLTDPTIEVPAFNDIKKMLKAFGL